MSALTRVDLDGMACGTPGCDHTSHTSQMFIHARCHPSAGTWAIYEDGVLTIRCCACEDLVCRIAVAEARPGAAILIDP